MQQQKRSRWQKAVYLTTGVYAVGALVFLVFGSGERQSFADDATQVPLRDTFNQNQEQTGTGR